MTAIDRTHARLCAITHAVLDRLGRAAPSDVLDEVKGVLARARIPYPAPHELRAAFDSVAIVRGKRSPQAPGGPVAPRPATSPAQASGGGPLTRTEAAAIFRRLCPAGVIRPMPNARPLTSRRHADRRIVAKQLAALVLDQVRQCEEAETAAAEHERTAGAGPTTKENER